MSTALAILTYVPAGGDPALRERLPNLMRSLKESGYPGPVAIVDDGSTDLEHVYYLGALSKWHTVIRKRYNSGICRAKNTCLRVIRDWKVDVGFIIEDDMEFVSDEWWDRYELAQKVSGVHHLSWMWEEAGECKMVEHNGWVLAERPKLNGCFLTFDEAVLNNVGGFPDFPARWGNTHINWSKRILKAGLIPFFADIPDSNQHIRLTEAQHTSALSHEDKLLAEHHNCLAGDAYYDGKVYQPITE